MASLGARPLPGVQFGSSAATSLAPIGQLKMASAAFSLGTMKGRSNTLNSGTRTVSGEAEVVTGFE